MRVLRTSGIAYYAVYTRFTEAENDIRISSRLRSAGSRCLGANFCCTCAYDVYIHVVAKTFGEERSEKQSYRYKSTVKSEQLRQDLAGTIQVLAQSKNLSLYWFFVFLWLSFMLFLKFIYFCCCKYLLSYVYLHIHVTVLIIVVVQL